MRKELAVLFGERRRFLGRFERYGSKPGYQGRVERTVLLRDVKDAYSDRLVTDHLWLNGCKSILELELLSGDLVEFNARVDQYVKGFVEKQVDYKLVYPSKFHKLSRLGAWFTVRAKCSVCDAINVKRYLRAAGGLDAPAGCETIAYCEVCHEWAEQTVVMVNVSEQRYQIPIAVHL